MHRHKLLIGGLPVHSPVATLATRSIHKAIHSSVSLRTRVLLSPRSLLRSAYPSML
jgi:hypothetical protein